MTDTSIPVFGIVITGLCVWGLLRFAQLTAYLNRQRPASRPLSTRIIRWCLRVGVVGGSLIVLGRILQNLRTADLP